ncbi:hypothetical protein [Mycolicibacterium fallax]|uniref:Uncharacterized protein n=1 Tax=Mycolicibacterium fallax TaxID=1793 RepID=A0A1X1R8A0_MYCFA|nr:hypothetical protein [Mycolicibacterium fallax]ORV00971.1 hypothetical protein AWC04_14965 [Mycolicibacterium fallax]BBZ00526.1 hypothetical protein MFAL_39920 [Mycolicibacterium fallax]
MNTLMTAERRYDLLMSEEAERARARSVFAWGMVGGLGLTLAGNLAAPLVAASVPLALTVFSLPPLLAGWGAHMALTVHRAAPRTVQGKRAAFGATALAAMLFIIALVASYTHLRELFIVGGYAAWLASVFAAAIDLALLAATSAWFAMRPASAAELRTARAEMEDEEAAERERLERERVERERAEAAAQEAAELERERLEAEREERAWEREQRALAAAERARALENSQVIVDGHVNDRLVNGHEVSHTNGHTVVHTNGHAVEAVNGHARPVPESVNVAVHESVNGHDRHLIEARALLARTGKRTPAENVAQVLQMLDDEQPILTIAASLGMGERTVRQIRDSRQPEFANAS